MTIKNKKLKFCATLAAMFIPVICFGDDLSDLLTETTNLATKTKLNVDYIPGTITVIRGDEMRALGVTNLADPNAFDMIVGMDTQSMSLRGTGADYGAYGNTIKWMINGKEFENEISTPNTWTVGRMVFPISIDLVDRIEVIRGSGSSLYGGNAVFGIVNIVTKKDYNGVFLGGDAMGGGKFGGNGGGSMSLKGENYSVNANVSGYQSEGSNLNVGLGGNYYNWIDGKQTPGYGPGQLSNANSGLSAMFDGDLYGYKTWVYHYQTSSAQGAYGLWIPNFPLPQSGQNYTVQSSKTHIGLEKTYKLIDNLKITPQVWYLQTQNNANNFYYVASNTTLNGQDGLTSRHYKEGRETAQIDAEYGVSTHTINVGVLYQEVRNMQDEKFANWFTPNAAFVPSGTFWPKPVMTLVHRAAYAQDQWNILEPVTITFGARYDAYAPQSMNKYQALSPRVAAVWRINESNILKGEYSKAFRPPTMTDLSDNSQLQPETVDTFELGYIYKKGAHTLKPSAFISTIYDMLAYDGYTGSAENRQYASRISGVELEYKYSHEIARLNLNGGYYNSYTPSHTLNGTGGDVYSWAFPSSSFDLAPSYMANAWVTFMPTTDYPTTVWYHFIGRQTKTESPTTQTISGVTAPINLSNGSLPAQSYVNVTQELKGLYKNLNLSLGVRNIFNTTMQSLRMPLSYYNQGSNHNADGVPYMGRSAWLDAVYKF